MKKRQLTKMSYKALTEEGCHDGPILELSHNKGQSPTWKPRQNDTSVHVCFYSIICVK